MDWGAALRNAGTIPEVIEAVDEFLSTRTDAYWRHVPEHLRRPLIVADVDLERWHHALVKHLSGADSPGKQLQELARVSLHAMARIHQIRLRAGRGDSNDDGFSAAPATRRCA